MTTFTVLPKDMPMFAVMVLGREAPLAVFPSEQEANALAEFLNSLGVVLDLEAPTKPHNFRPDASIPGEFWLRWDASTDDIGVIGYSLHVNGDIHTLPAGTLAFQLPPDTVGTFSLWAFDAKEKYSASAVAEYVGLDVTAPTVPTGLSVSADGILTFQPSEDPATYARLTSGLRLYRLNRDGDQVATSAAPSFDLKVTGSGSYTVQAEDHAGNLSAPSAVVTWAEPVPEPQPDGWPATRNLLLWPGSVTSIWNTPIAMNAVFQPKGTPTAANGGIGHQGIFADLAFIFADPTAPLTEVRYNFNGFPAEYERCNESGELLDRVPCDPNYVMPVDWTRAGKNKPNAPGAFIMPDGRTMKYFAPIGRCRVGGPITARAGYQNRDWYATEGKFIDGPMNKGSHGGSHLNSFAGVWRIHEVGGPIRHALQITMPLKFSYPEPVWPATNMEDHATGTNPRMSAGTLYAIPPSINITELGLETPIGKILAKTLQDYGCYATDTIPNATAYGLRTEQGPAGNFEAAFQQRWGLRFREFHGTEGGIAQYVAGTPWGRDIRRLADALHVVISNGPLSIGGGGGIRRAPLAPPVS
jgi:hypothetical protein